MPINRGDRQRKITVKIGADSSEAQQSFKTVGAGAAQLGTKMAVLAQATERAAQKTVKLSDSFKNAAFEVQAKRIAALDAKLRGMKTHVGIEIDVDKQGKFAKAISDMGSFVTTSLKQSGIYGAAAIIAAVAAAAPLAGAALTAGILLGLGGGVLALGIARAAKSPAVSAAFGKFGETAKASLDRFAKNFEGPLVTAAGTFTAAMKKADPVLQRLGQLVAPLVGPLSKALADMGLRLLPGIEAAVKASVPLFLVLANKAPALGAAISKFLEAITKGGPGAQKFLEDVLNFLIWVIPQVGNWLGWLSNRYLDWRNGVTRVVGVVRAAWSGFLGFFQGIGNKIGSVIGTIITKYQQVRDKTTSVLNAMKSGFRSGVSAIDKEWTKLQNVTKKPVSFFVNTVYNKGILPLWNRVTSTLGFGKPLPVLKFAEGGTVGTGKGTRDDVPALLTRGEGILTVAEMTKLGGPRGFEQMRGALAQFNKGGVAGGDGIGDRILGFGKSLLSKGKDLVLGVAQPVVRKLADSLRPLLSGLGNTGLGNVLRGGGNRALDALVSLVGKKDKEVPAASAGMGYQAMMRVIRSRFPGTDLISGMRRGSRTLSGNLSYHASGRAVDIPAIRKIADWLYANFKSRTKELITPWRDRMVHNGSNHKYSRAVEAQHGVFGSNAHIHWAMDGASVVQPGWFAGYNGTGKPETLVNKDVIKDAGTTINIQSLVLNGVQDVKGLRNELIKLATRNGGRSGLPN